MDVHLRRRVAFAAVLTLVAIPAYLVLDRDAAGSTEPPTVVDGSVELAAVDTTSPFTLPPTTLAGPIFLDNTAVVVPPAVIDVVRPEPTSDNLREGRATFQRFETTAGEVRLCTDYDAINGALLTVTNIANGLTVVCRNRYGTPLPAGVNLVLDTDLYTRIADLADAPIFVRIDW